MHRHESHANFKDFLIGSALQSVRNPLDTGGTYPGHAEGKVITGDLGLEQGLRIINTFTVDSNHEEWGKHPSKFRPPGVYEKPSNRKQLRAERDHRNAKVRKRLFCAISYQKSNICQDRLGTNIGETPKRPVSLATL